MEQTKGKGLSRRSFLRGACGMVAFPTIISATALGAEGRPAASERIVMGTIGFGGRASGVMPAFMREDDVQMVAVCDVKGNRRKLAQDTVNRHYGNTDCDAYIDLRELLARDDIDAVLIATGDYWHSAAACLSARAGKDMYCEKPMSVTITEGRALVETMKRYGRIFQCGTQRRNVSQFMFAANLVHKGLLGELKTVHAEKAPNWHETYETVLPAEPEPPREVFDWDLWLGPAAWRPYNSNGDFGVVIWILRAGRIPSGEAIRSIFVNGRRGKTILRRCFITLSAKMWRHTMRTGLSWCFVLT
jgi:hypothetical protein